MRKYLVQKISLFLGMIKFSHTLFALPFALCAVAIAVKYHRVTFWQFFWIVCAMATARSAAMGFNRIVDAAYDKANPRTACREIPAGKLSVRSASWFVAASSILFLASCAMLSWLCFALAFPVLAFLYFYSYTKRFTRWSHIVLGVAIGMAPAGAWIAVTGSLSPGIICLSLALMAHISGFDIIYAIQDMDFDRKAGLHSLPALMGVWPSLFVSAGLHIIAIFFLLLTGKIFSMGPVYYYSCMVIALLYVGEHAMVTPRRFDRIPIAFFHMNSAISLVLLAGVTMDLFL